MLRQFNSICKTRLTPIQLVNTQQYLRSEILKQPKMRLRSFEQIVPPPGLDLKIPNWEPELFLLKIGKGTSEYADKFENINEIFNARREDLKKKGLPPRERRHILKCIEKLRRGLLSFEYLWRRTTTSLNQKKK